MAAAAVPSSSPLRVAPEEVPMAVRTFLSLGSDLFARHCMKVVVDLGIPNILGSETLVFEDMVQRLPGNPNPTALLPCLRMLAYKGVLKETAGAAGEFCFALTQAGALLQTGVEGQPHMAPGALWWGEPALLRSFFELTTKVSDASIAATPFELANGKPVFEYLAEHPDTAQTFNEFMSFLSTSEIQVILAKVPWSDFDGKRVVEVGGNVGKVMSAVKTAFPGIRTTVLDLPSVVENAVGSNAPAEGVELLAGDMFDPSTIPAADLIFMKHILHDWDDDNCQRILESCRAALSPGGKIVLVDAVLADAGETTKFMEAQLQFNLNMLMIGGKERSKREWIKLAKDAGFEDPEFQTETGSPLSAIITLKTSNSDA